MEVLKGKYPKERRLLGVPFDLGTAKALMEGQHGAATRLLYQLYILLQKKTRLGLTGAVLETMQPPAVTRLHRVEKQIYTEADVRMQKIAQRFDKRARDAYSRSVISELEREERRRHLQEQMRLQQIQKQRQARRKQQEIMERIQTATVQIPKPPASRSVGAQSKHRHHHQLGTQVNTYTHTHKPEVLWEEQLIGRLMRQSQQERRMAVQLMQIRQQKEVLRQNRIQDRINRKAELCKEQELHNRLSAERAQFKHRKYLNTCRGILEQIVDLATKTAEYRLLTAKKVPLDQGWVLDGFPVEISQAQLLEQALGGVDLHKEHTRTQDLSHELAVDKNAPQAPPPASPVLHLAVLLEVSDEQVLERYQHSFYSAVRELNADHPGRNLEQRQVQHRILGFQDSWSRLEEWFGVEQKILVKVKADVDEDGVYHALESALLQAMDIPDEVDSKKVAVSSPVVTEAPPPEPGSSSWVYVDNQLPKDITEKLLSQWENICSSYVSNVKAVMQNLRKERNLIIHHLYNIRHVIDQLADIIGHYIECGTQITHQLTLASSSLFIDGDTRVVVTSPPPPQTFPTEVTNQGSLPLTVQQLYELHSHLLNIAPTVLSLCVGSDVLSEAWMRLTDSQGLSVTSDLYFLFTSWFVSRHTVGIHSEVIGLSRDETAVMMSLQETVQCFSW
ncbi:Sperm flagellar protein 2 [Bagarius yarrelli]|uniref:Sperm flagellar protein 2 n=1 Tax=Bagarius yarrelli TaxID=175774 RepID=A0A556VCS5_BAGYA|nr:Sperm flagellar protein 2 [Bagarius yarrelli]